MKKLLSLLIVAVIVCCAGAVLADEAVPGTPAMPFDVTDNVKVNGTITLTEGWNLIAIPVLPPDPLTVGAFMKMVATSDFAQRPVLNSYPAPEMRLNWNVSVVAVYKNGRFRTYTPDNATYNMVPGEAYFVHCQYLGPRPAYDIAGPQYPMPVFHLTTTVSIMGKAVSASVSLDLNKGWNGAALMRKEEFLVDYKYPLKLSDPSYITLNQTVAIDSIDTGLQPDVIGRPIRIGSTVSQLSKELAEQGVKAKRIVFWDAYNQKWDQQELPCKDPIVGADGLITTIELIPGRIITQNEGFFLLCSENGLYIPGLRQIQNPPIPPVPPIPPIPVPQRVSYTGTIEGILYIPEAKPPYDFVLQYEVVLTDSVAGATSVTVIQVPIKGADKNIEARLADLYAMEDKAGNKQKHFVEGVMQTIEWSGMSPEDRVRHTDVLIVENIDAFRL